MGDEVTHDREDDHAQNVMNSDVDEGGNPYLAQMHGHDTHEAEVQRTIRDRGFVAIGLFILLAASVYGNVYQMRQVKEVHHLTTVDEHGRPVSTLVRRVENIGAEDPLKQLMTERYVADWVTEFRTRTMDKQFLAIGLNTAQRHTAGDAGGKFETAITREDPFTRIKNERVEVKLKGQPIPLTSTVWQAEWHEQVTNVAGNPLRTELFTGRFQLAEKPEWATAMNPFGFKVVDWGMEQLSR